jgi:hypothetical protein
MGVFHVFLITAEVVKNAYLGQGETIKQKTLMEVFTQHNKEMAASLKLGTIEELLHHREIPEKIFKQSVSRW